MDEATRLSISKDKKIISLIEDYNNIRKTALSKIEEEFDQAIQIGDALCKELGEVAETKAWGTNKITVHVVNNQNSFTNNTIELLFIKTDSTTSRILATWTAFIDLEEGPYIYSGTPDNLHSMGELKSLFKTGLHGAARLAAKSLGEHVFEI